MEYKPRTHSTQDSSSNVVVANNIIKNCYWGIFTIDRGSGNIIEDVTIRGNQVSGTGNAAILLEDAVRVKVEGNHIPTVPGGQRGIECRVDGADIADNTVLDNAGVGINVTSEAAHVQGNRVEGGTTALAVQFGGTKASIVANRAVSTGTQAVYLDSNSEECFVSVNDLNGNPSVNDNGMNNVIENNNQR